MSQAGAGWRKVLRTGVALLAAGALASCLAGERHGMTGVAPAGDDEQQAIRLLNARCTVCHSTDLIRQQRLNASQWQAEVRKMVGWGAQLSAAEQEVLVAYLSSRYHPGAPEVIEEKPLGKHASSASAGMDHVVLVGHAPRGAAVYAQNCLPCHGEAAAGGVGPKLAGNPILKHDESFQQTVMQGRGAMPAWGAILKPQEIADVHAWLKSLR